MEKSIAPKPMNGMSTQVHVQDQILRTDLIVPYLSMGQGLSDAVQEKKVDLGDIYRSTTAEILGNPDTPLEIILLHTPRPEWVYEQKGKSRFEYRRSEPRHAGNESLPWNFWSDDDGVVELAPGTKGATEWRRVKRLSVFALLPQDITAMEEEMKKVEAGEMPDPNKALLPVAISFRSTSYNTGRELINFVAQAASFKVPIWKYKLPLFNAMEQNDDGSFYVWKTDRTKAKAVDKAHLPYVENWVNQLNSGVELVTHEEGDTASATEKGSVDAKVAREVC